MQNRRVQVLRVTRHCDRLMEMSAFQTKACELSVWRDVISIRMTCPPLNNLPDHHLQPVKMNKCLRLWFKYKGARAHTLSAPIKHTAALTVLQVLEDMTSSSRILGAVFNIITVKINTPDGQLTRHKLKCVS